MSALITRALTDRRANDYCVWTDRRQSERRTTPLGDEIDRLREINKGLLAALQDRIEPRAKGWKVTDWDIHDEQARAAIAKAAV